MRCIRVPPECHSSVSQLKQNLHRHLGQTIIGLFLLQHTQTHDSGHKNLGVMDSALCTGNTSDKGSTEAMLAAAVPGRGEGGRKLTERSKSNRKRSEVKGDLPIIAVPHFGLGHQRTVHIHQENRNVLNSQWVWNWAQMNKCSSRKAR